MYSISNSKINPEAVYNPVGTSDSEAVFCAILNAIRSEFSTLPSLEILYDAIQRLCNEIVLFNMNNDNNVNEPVIFNFLLSCGEQMQFAFSWPGSRPGSDVWNGLYYQIRSGDTNNVIEHLDSNSMVKDPIAILATKPLNIDETWVEINKGTLLLFNKGLPYTLCDGSLVLDTFSFPRSNSSASLVLQECRISHPFIKGSEEFRKESVAVISPLLATGM